MNEFLFAKDERLQQINGRVSFFVLMFTHIAMGLVVFYKAYILDVPSQQFREWSWILLFSSYGYWAARMYFSGVLPSLRVRTLLLIYVVFVAIIAIPTMMIHGLPDLSDWQNNILPVLLGPAIIVGIYAVIIYFGGKRLEKEINN